MSDPLSALRSIVAGLDSIHAGKQIAGVNTAVNLLRFVADPASVEKIARLIAPDTWAWKPLARTPNEGPAQRAAYDEMDRNDTADNEADRRLSLLKATAILAALAAAATGGE